MFKYADYIYKIYEEQSFTQAAKKLFISQPSLSATIKKAEDELGFKVFSRGNGPIMLTDAGRVYIAAVEEMLRIERNVRNNVNNIYSLEVGDVSVSGAAFISSYILPEIIMEFSKKYPKINVLILESNSMNLQEKLFSEEIEILIDYDFNGDNFEFFPLLNEHVLLAVPKQHSINSVWKSAALTAKDIIGKKHLKKETEGINLQELRNERFIQLKKGNNMEKCGVRICEEYGFKPKSLIDVDQLITAYNMAGSGMGVTFTTDTVVRCASHYDNLVFYKLNSPYAKRTLYIAYKKKGYISPAVSEFVSTATEIYKKG